MNSHDEKFNSIKIDDFQCWKARFLVIFFENNFTNSSFCI
jgi:hypothetical protein